MARNRIAKNVKEGDSKMKFFMSMKPPTATHQEKKATVKNGKIYFYEPPALKDARAKLGANLARHSKGIPMHGPLSCVVKWLFPVTKNHKNGERKWTKPDGHNLNKLLFDIMTDLDFWVDDAQVCCEIIERFYADNPGIYIEIEQIKE